MFIGDNLKMLRKRAGKSQEDIANELGFNRSTYSGYENGVAQPNIENLIIFSQFYSLTIDQLLKLNLVDFKESDWLNLEQSGAKAKPARPSGATGAATKETTD